MDTIIIIDDDADLCALLKEYLGSEGVSVRCFAQGRQGIDSALGQGCDLVILDVCLPDMSGFEVLAELRSRSQLPVLMLTGRTEDVDRIVGLEMGADDYQPKPFVPRELLARIRTILRRCRASHAEAARIKTPPVKRLQVGDLLLDRGTYSAYRGNHQLCLTNAEFILLQLLLEAGGELVSREEISLKALGRELTPYDRSIDVHVSNLRRKLGPSSDGAQRIVTVRGAGYLLVRSHSSQPPGPSDSPEGPHANASSDATLGDSEFTETKLTGTKGGAA